MPIEVINYAKSQIAGGKFVVLRQKKDDDSGLLLISDFNQDFQHADIVRRWRTITGQSPEAVNLKIAGGGWWKMEESDLLVLYGRSAAYGRFDPTWLSQRLTPGRIFHESRLDVR